MGPELPSIQKPAQPGDLFSGPHTYLSYDPTHLKQPNPADPNPALTNPTPPYPAQHTEKTIPNHVLTEGKEDDTGARFILVPATGTQGTASRGPPSLVDIEGVSNLNSRLLLYGSTRATRKPRAGPRSWTRSRATWGRQ
ncbi:hypothetical protein Salat_0663400 [Sesamum alatum]|uniref:Uncharacterized protein n=1 Tax=Sesamum alatum TaxID=300844 RepID=A0AAE2CUW4_9LAMI|nr:hypothetical protein Salat_0663400 [Sesamum alatum]